MKIKINNLFKVGKNKTKIKDKLGPKEKFSNTAIEKNLTFKVYSSEGKIIKYESRKKNKSIEKENENIQKHQKTRKGASNYLKNEENKHAIIKKYNIEEDKKIKNQLGEKNNKIKNKGYLLFLLMCFLAGGSIYFGYSKYKVANEESYAVYTSQEVSETSNLPEEQSSISNNIDTIQKEESIPVSTKVKNKVVTKPIKKVEELKFVKPIEGEILKIYSKDKVIYSKTLELWKTHEGIDIKAEENTIVKSIEKGTVEKIYDDAFYGKTIVIDHGQGYKSSYSNLSNEIFVKEKQVISKLTKIGKIGKTAIGEIKDESHLHFSLIKNNEICDPSSIFK